ncbi:MAG: succinate dehydrogenase, cytochrome b556 subunit [Ferrovum sp. 37-45-19]|uniref:succinate dehydrogenase, cytochrome b556 subunit n=1 Tax=Ferrovum sp. JA12 TaxID=1356299 RepID=UPI0007039CA6|nr:succinate dehydrogenase, cytochrome b556 subunit [Ferrovum sp. JA12]OYV80280.1 MAG: succinate dehydrogenase, cytochrome b556 subunit [Ferrovum sp. 21-44-67]OYV95026.1 MAG: succinate dehydrogenase, cytochrome b556 subunit [Ferrovum sp. 37-45-19]OZB32217.1 MAG: succinate dehydrogenase, cytochrome b556 subunit [Ferrovum sp. 34-44-207]HQT80918.1 succinate dehydrogenase, cytochrome b556 subunit [Ferrovaceae bacterium]KRH78760.1 succinate dehydrogenase cytochrome b556 subunit [Ferrovum sp. JA12]
MSVITKKRPKNLDLTTIKLPVPGVVSILHRISGALLFLIGIPFLLWVVQSVIHSAAEYQQMVTWLQHPLLKLSLLLMLWSFLHHFCAGIRYLLLDLHIGIELAGARLSSMIVLMVSILLTLIIGVKLW